MSIEVRIFEGNQRPTTPRDLHAELFLPDKLDTTNRCDRCGAQALHAFAIHQPGNEDPGTLLACNHHARAWHNAGMLYLAHHDYRTPHDQWVKTTQAAFEAAAKGITTKKLDDSNLVTNPPEWQSQWDSNYWG